jgi:hypothetical protein
LLINAHFHPQFYSGFSSPQSSACRPSLWTIHAIFGFITGDAVADDGSSTQFLLASADGDTVLVIATVQAALESWEHFSKINSLTPPSTAAKEIDDLGIPELPDGA